MLSALVFPLLFLLVFGSGLSSTMGNLAPGVDFTKFMFPGIIGMTVIMTSFASGISVVWDREFGFLRELLIAPISRATVAIGKTLGGATVATIQGTVVLLLAPLLGIPLSWEMALLLPLMFLVACALTAMGVLIASRMKSMETHGIVMNMVMMPMIFLSGIFFPVSGLPDWMNVLVKINPATYAIDPIRRVALHSIEGAASEASLSVSLFGHTMSIAEELLLVTFFGLVMILLAMWSFSIQE
jgi:ABC-2 type transport system permease protein